VKLEFIPVQFDNDLIQIDNLDALAMMVQSLNQNDNYDSQQAEVMQARAVKEMNLELRNKLPIDTVPVRFQPYGNAFLNRQMIGRMQ